MADIIDLTREKFTNIANAIRSATGSDEVYTVDEMPSVIEGLSGETNIDDGFYVVNFYDYDQILLESHTAKVGNQIGSPLSFNATHWGTSDGTRIVFPITSDAGGEVINIYSFVDAYSDMLYNHFGVDRAVYPYVPIKYKLTLVNVNLYFIGSFVVIAGNVAVIKNAMGYSQCDLSIVTNITISNIVNELINANPSMEQTIDSLQVNADSGSYIFSNTDIYVANDGYHFEVFE